MLHGGAWLAASSLSSILLKRTQITPHLGWLCVVCGGERAGCGSRLVDRLCVCVVSSGSTSGRALKPGAARLGVVGCESWASGESRFVRRGAADLDNGQVVREW